MLQTLCEPLWYEIPQNHSHNLVIINQNNYCITENSILLSFICSPHVVYRKVEINSNMLESGHTYHMLGFGMSYMLGRGNCTLYYTAG